jgi:acyl-CoA dehydrogenase
MKHDPLPCDTDPVYLADRRELEFLLWELFDIEHTLFGQAPYQQATRAGVQQMLDRAQQHAGRLAAAFYAADRDPARRVDDQTVHIPPAYHALWQEHLRDWFWMRQQADLCGSAPSGTQPLPHVVTQRLPHVVIQAAMEMFFGANPSFMPYSGFTPAACALLRDHGTPLQRQRFLARMESVEWDACMCATEREAGSDLSAVRTSARHLDGEVYAITGEKILVSAGMHSLTGNTLYLVLGRISTSRSSPLSLSCFLVPRHWVEEDGSLSPNHVVCAEVHDKMGLNGCANTRLLFGRDQVTRGYLLGNAPNVALLQLHGLMSRARIETGLFGVSVASSAYLRALRFARRRVQGATFDKSSNPWAPKVAIIEHHDVQRMLLDMKARVEGCRALVGRVTLWASQLQACRHAPAHGDDPAGNAGTSAEAERLLRLIALFSPITKAYVSEEAWGVVTQAIQVHGSAGYLRNSPLEQYARDVKVLTLWEGTTYIQAQDLVRDKLAFGRKAVVMRDFDDEVRRLLVQRDAWPELADDFDRLTQAHGALGAALAELGRQAEAGRLMQLSQFATRFLTAFGDVALAWNLLDAACVAQRRLRALPPGDPQGPFYRGKLKCARYFIRNVLPRVTAIGQLIAQAEHCHVEADSLEFAGPAPHDQHEVA